MSYMWLAHHGIKGQKWGIRRFQNRDGSLTSKGKARLQNKQADHKNEKKLTNKQKTALVVGAAAVGTLLAIYGVHRYRDVLNDRVMKALAAEGKVICDDPANHLRGRHIPNLALINTKKIELESRVRAYEGSKDPFKIVSDIVTKQDYLKEHKVARDVSRGRTSIWDDSKPFGTDYQFRLYNVGENPGNNPNFDQYRFDPKITIGDVLRGTKKSRS